MHLRRAPRPCRQRAPAPRLRRFPRRPAEPPDPSTPHKTPQLVQLVKRPFVSMVSQQLLNFEGTFNAYAHAFPELEGLRRGARCWFLNGAGAAGLRSAASPRGDAPARAPSGVGGSADPSLQPYIAPPLPCVSCKRSSFKHSRFGEVAFRLPDGIALGVVNRDIGGQALMAPPVEYIVRGA
jgi:hypothetical protein